MFVLIRIITIFAIAGKLNAGNHNLNAYDQYQPTQRVSQCQLNDFLCVQERICIPSDKLCDGIADCNDSSDETFKQCGSYSCEDYSFQCSYGACIDRDLICDGKNDCADGSDETTSECASNLNVPETCSPQEFTCDTGECISDTLVCDGRGDCSNGFDETREQCQKNKCEDYSFQCNYGACIDKDLICDGKDNCYDSSDEHPQFCQFHKVDKEIITDGCVLPQVPRYGGYKVKYGTKEIKGSALQLVPIGSFVQFFCNIGYTLRPKVVIIICQDNKNWTSTIPKCVVECPRLSSISQDITYSVGPKEPLVPGTTASLTCKLAYHQPVNDPHYRHISCLPNGSWSKPVYNCTPICGEESTNVRPLIINGTNADSIKYPWNVGIYRSHPQNREDHIHICGGTIISERLIISVAHCFYNATSESVSDPTIYSVGGGKYYREWHTSKTLDPYQQKRQVAFIYIKEGFKGIFSAYVNDIAIIELKSADSFSFNEFIRPACIDWDNKYENEAFKRDSTGIVVGWGLTSSEGSRSKTLRKIELPFIPKYPDCYDSVPPNFRKYLFDDKICAGYNNGSSVCEGDSGSGLLFRNNHDGLWYLRALVSIDPAVGISCDPYSFTAFTKISYYRDWLSEFFATII